MKTLFAVIFAILVSLGTPAQAEERKESKGQTAERVAYGTERVLYGVDSWRRTTNEREAIRARRESEREQIAAQREAQLEQIAAQREVQLAQIRADQEADRNRSAERGLEIIVVNGGTGGTATASNGTLVVQVDPLARPRRY